MQYAQVGTKFGTGYPKLGELASQIAQLDASVEAELKNLSTRYRNEYEAALRSEQMLRHSFEGQKQKAYQLNQGAAEHAILKREVVATQELYQTLQLKLKQAGIVAGLASANVGLLDAAQAPSEPIAPRPWLDLLIGLGTGAGLGMLSAVVLESMDDTISAAEQAEMLTGLPVLAAIPLCRAPSHGQFRFRAKPLSGSDRLIALRRPESLDTECYRTLRNGLWPASSSRRPQVVVITSPVVGEGKTATCMNLAVVLAENGAKVLLVDADLRAPSIHEVFGSVGGPGFTAVLRGECDERELVSEARDISSLSLLAAGDREPQPADLLRSAAIAEVFGAWRSRYDYVVIDTPPVSLVSDAILLARAADAVLLVARVHVTTPYSILRTKRVLDRAHIKVAGVVLNAVDTRYQAAYQYSRVLFYGDRKGAYSVERGQGESAGR